MMNCKQGRPEIGGPPGKLTIWRPLKPIFFNIDCRSQISFNPLNPELNPICYLLALLAHHFIHVGRIRNKSLTLRLLMSYIYMECIFLMFLDHTQRRSTVGRTPLDQ
jgi:hypothetical protein